MTCELQTFSQKKTEKKISSRWCCFFILSSNLWPTNKTKKNTHPPNHRLIHLLSAGWCKFSDYFPPNYFVILLFLSSVRRFPSSGSYTKQICCSPSSTKIFNWFLNKIQMFILLRFLIRGCSGIFRTKAVWMSNFFSEHFACSRCIGSSLEMSLGQANLNPVEVSSGIEHNHFS